MGSKQTLTDRPGNAAARTALAGLCAGAIVLMASLAAAQDGQPAPAPPQDQSVIGNFNRWFNAQVESMNSSLKDARKRMENFGQDASVTAKTTVDGARNAADAVARIPNSRVVTGHEKCLIAPNGAPDCVAAANAVCKAKGFTSGKSVDMTTAEVCPAKVLLSGRNSGPECRNETFVSRVLCQ